MIMVCASVLVTAYATGAGDGGNSIPTVIESGSGVETASYIIYKDGDYTCLKNGTTGRIESRNMDSATVIQEALDDGGVIYIAPETYTITKTMNVGADTHLYMGTATLVDTFANTYMFAVNGNYVANHTVVGNVSAGAVSITLSSVAGLAVDDYICIRDDNIDHGRAAYNGEIFKIIGIVGSTLTINSVVLENYYAADNAMVQSLNMVDNVLFNGGTILGNDTTALHHGFYINYASNFAFQNVHLKHINTIGIFITTSINGEISDCNIEDSNTNGYGYGVMLANSVTNTVISGCTFMHNRHGIAMGGNGGSFGYAHDNIIESCIFYGNGLGTQLNSHEGTGSSTPIRDCLFLSNGGCSIDWGGTDLDISGCRFVGSTGDYAVLSRQYYEEIIDVSIQNSIFENCLYGIQIDCDQLLSCDISGNTFNVRALAINIKNSPNGTAVVANNVVNSIGGSSNQLIGMSGYKDIVLSNNIISNAGRAGVLLAGLNSGTVSNNVVYDCGVTGSGIATTDSGIGMWDCNNLLFSGNVIYDSGVGTQKYGIGEYGACDHNQYLGNRLSGNTNGQLLMVGGNDTVLDNVGYADKDWGQALITAGQTSVEVSYTLGEGAAVVLVSLYNSNVTWYISGLTAAKFVVNIAAPLGSDLALFWMVSIA